MANGYDIAHRFANKLEGKNGCVKAGNVRYEGRNYYSYYSVFGKWLDIKNNVVAIFDGSTSISSSKHMLHKGLFPDDVHVFPLDFGGGWSGWNNCNLVSTYNFNDEDFTFGHRMRMIDHYVGRIYEQLEAINGGKSKGLENVSFEAWDYIEELCSLYKDTTINKYLKTLKHVKPLTKNGERVSTSLNHKKVNTEIDAKKTLVKLLKDGERNVETLTDALFGEGTYKTYWDYCARYRKQSEKREKMEMLCKRLGIRSPYENWGGYGVLGHEMSADDIRKMTAKERLDIHFKALAHKEYKKHEDERKEKYNKNFRNAYKWIVGVEPQKSWNGYLPDVNGCVNKNNGEQYVWGTRPMFGFYWLDLDVYFDYDGFRTSTDKEQWIEDFYAKCKEVSDNRRAIAILGRIKAHTKEKKHSWDDDAYINDDYLRENTTEEEFNLCAEFIRKQDKHYADEEARRRAEEIARLKREEEKRKEREYMEQVKQEQINECLSRGLEGCRDLWRNHFVEIDTAEDKSNNDANFFFGGNVLLRLSLSGNAIETSKHISIPVEKCKKMWKIVQKWHNDPSSFKSCEINTLSSGKYTISSYKNDILTSGCHKIPYVEMERVMAMVN